MSTAATLIQNPILPGFHPDPSICRVGEDYYIAVSTFEWWPGVRLYHSRDLAHWRHLGSALDRVSQLDMRGCPNSGGIWAPCLTHADGKFWLIYTNVRQHGSGVVHDTPNYLVTAEHIEGPWSEPVFLNSSGFDPSLFHDDDGRKYIVQMQTGEAATPRRFDGILLQGYDPASARLLGDPVNIWPGSPIGITEGPHLLKKDGWYYLITAEGGTSVRHAISVCRSRTLAGPYEIHPQNPMLTAYQKEHLTLWSTGHGCFVDTPAGEWFTVHLCHRPLQRPGRLVLDREENKSVPLGRETCLQKFRWDADGWPRLAHGDNSPRDTVEVNLPAHPWLAAPASPAFSGPALPPSSTPCASRPMPPGSASPAAPAGSACAAAIRSPPTSTKASSPAASSTTTPRSRRSSVSRPKTSNRPPGSSPITIDCTTTISASPPPAPAGPNSASTPPPSTNSPATRSPSSPSPPPPPAFACAWKCAA